MHQPSLDADHALRRVDREDREQHSQAESGDELRELGANGAAHDAPGGDVQGPAESTLPWRKCCVAPEMAVGTMTASEIPWATCWSMPITITIAGTITMPPPTPMVPATNPVNVPAISAAT